MAVKPSDRWLLPDGVDELLPNEARLVEQTRRRVADNYRLWGFELVSPPLIEYLDSLLTGTGETMDLQTFKLVDQQNGRTLGVRADMTPQVARMDAHALRSDTPNRLCYIGTVLRAQADGFGGTRSPQQFGAELFGHAGPESDIEIVRLMLETVLQSTDQPKELTLALGHVGIYAALVNALDLDAAAESEFFEAVQRGSIPDMHALSDHLFSADAEQAHKAKMWFEQLMQLRGGVGVLQLAEQAFAEAPSGVADSIDTLSVLVSAITQTHPNIKFHIDLCELRGFQYHTGVLFSVHTAAGDELARGGRYDDVGAAFGHSRPATGFSGDLIKLAKHSEPANRQNAGIYVAQDSVGAAWQEICRLRQAGEQVLTELPGTGQTPQSVGCDRQLLLIDGQWQIRTV